MKVPCLLRAALSASGSRLLHARRGTEGCKHVSGADPTTLLGGLVPQPLKERVPEPRRR